MENTHGLKADLSVDVLVVGSGAGGLVAAITASAAGKEVLVVESTELIGGCSGMSGGGLWIPDNPIIKEAGVVDSYDNALAYLNDVIADVGPASSSARRHAYLTEGPAMVDFLRKQGMKFYYDRGYSDYYPHTVGGSVEGRCLGGEIYNLKNLPAPWRDRIRGYMPLPMTTMDARVVNRTFSGAGLSAIAKIVFGRLIGGSLTGKKNAGLGVALIGRLLEIALKQGVKVWINSPLLELIVDDRRVIGGIVDKDGTKTRINASAAVILAAGGFAQNLEMREEYQEQPITTAWTSASPGDLGDGIRAGIRIGAKTALMDDAWWGPSMVMPDGTAQFMLWERSNPHCIIVDTEGKRYMNESASYVDCGHWMYEHNEGSRSIPSYLILDTSHRSSYMLGMLPPKMTSHDAITSGFLVKAATLEGLAEALGMNAKNLVQSVMRFNRFCETGKDLDYQRGDSAYDRLYSDPKVKPNPNLGKVAKAPFYALKVYPGDLSTKGGLLTDEYARVVREDGSVIGGLYASGNNSASVMGRTYPGPGATIGATTTFGYIAAKHASQTQS
jgi:3-oxosteroid 1-dehydrogenase